MISTSCAFGQSLADSLLLHYPLDGNAMDISPNGFHGTVVGATFGPDRFGTPNMACYFDGVNDFIEMPNVNDLKAALPVSFSFWVKYDGTSAASRNVFNTSFEEDRNTGVYLTSQATTARYAINYGDGSYNYGPTSRRTYVSYNDIDTTQWHHVLAVVNSALDMEIYVDCQTDGGLYSGFGGALQYSLLPGTIGKHDANLGSNNYFLHGWVDDFRYWNREVTAMEVDSLCNDLMTGMTHYSPDATVLEAYYDPMSEILHIRGREGSRGEFRIVDASGRMIKYGIHEGLIDISDLLPGTYVLLVLDQRANRLTHRFNVGK